MNRRRIAQRLFAVAAAGALLIAQTGCATSHYHGCGHSRAGEIFEAVAIVAVVAAEIAFHCCHCH